MTIIFRDSIYGPASPGKRTKHGDAFFPQSTASRSDLIPVPIICDGRDNLFSLWTLPVEFLDMLGEYIVFVDNELGRQAD